MSTDLLLLHPGEVLLEEFLRTMAISQYRLALSISVDIDLRRGCFIALSEDFWLKIQASHDLKPAKQALEGLLPSMLSGRAACL